MSEMEQTDRRRHPERERTGKSEPEEDGRKSGKRGNDSDKEAKHRPEKEDDEDEKQQEDSDEKGDEGDDQKEGDEKPEKKPFWRRPVLLSVMIAAVVLITAGVVIWWLMTRNYEGTDDAFIDGHLIHVAPRVAGLVLSLNVNDNQFVHAGDVVINIDPAPFQASYDAAKAAVAQAEANVQQSQADFVAQQASAEQARAAITVAEANEVNAARNYKRYHELPEAARSQQDVDNATAAYQAAQAEVVEAQRRFAAAQAQVRASQTSISSSQAQLAAAKAQLEAQGLNLQYCNVRAGQDGFITRRTVEKGNYVQVGQEILDVVSPNVWVTANYKETQLTYIRPGEPATVTVDAYPQRKYRAHVDSIQTGTGAVFSVLPPENATGNFIKIVQRVPVKIVFDEKLDHVFAPGESVEPSVDIRSGKQ